jgi:hypothetical protein
MFYELTPGNYLVCVSATCNEPFDYALGLVVEFADNEENFILTEDQDPSSTSFVLQEAFNATSEGVFDILPSPVTVNTTITQLPNLSINVGEIASGIFVQINNKNSDNAILSWVIGDSPPTDDNFLVNRIELDFTETWPQSAPRSHSLDEWRRAWQRDHALDDKFPSGVFAPLTNLS